MEYIQTLATIKSRTIIVEETGRTWRQRFITGAILAVKDTIYIDNILDGIRITAAGEEHIVDANQPYRHLTTLEAKYYLSEVIVTEDFLLVPTEEILKINHLLVDAPTYPARIGMQFYIEGYSFDTHDNSYVPYTYINNLPYEILLDKVELNVQLEQLIEQTFQGLNKINTWNSQKH